MTLTIHWKACINIHLTQERCSSPGLPPSQRHMAKDRKVAHKNGAYGDVVARAREVVGWEMIQVEALLGLACEHEGIS